MDDSVVKEFYRLLHRIHQCRPNISKQSELSNVEFFMLMEISLLKEHGKEEITLGDIIECTDMTMSAASKKISILEKKGYVIRKASSKDKRNINIMLTESGEKICEDEKRKKHEWVTKVLSEMGEEDSRKMFELVDKLFDIIENKS